MEFMSKLKIACLGLGGMLLLTIVILQAIQPSSSMDGWENVNVELSHALQLESSLDEVQPQASQLNDLSSEPIAEAIELPMNVMINLNSATLEQLDALPGIGPSKAKAIMDYRLKYGDFRTLEQIMEVKGIGPKLFEKMK